MADLVLAFTPYSSGEWERTKRYGVYWNDDEHAQFIRFLRKSEQKARAGQLVPEKRRFPKSTDPGVYACHLTVSGRLAPATFSSGSISILMASSEVDMKFLGQFAANIQGDHPLLAQSLFQIFGNLTMLSEKVIRARKLRRLDTTRDTKSVDLYCRIIWYAREGLKLLEEYVLPMVANYGELKVLSYKLRASFYHLYVLFHNQPPVSLKSGTQVSTPPGLTSPRRVDKGKGVDRGSPSDPYRPSSVQPTHPLEGGPVGGPFAVRRPPLEFAPNFLVPAQDYRPFTLTCFQEATKLAEKHLWGSHPLRLSVKVEFAAFLYDCLHEREQSRRMAKATIAEVYNAAEGMDDEMFEDAAQLVGILGKMMKRGLGSGGSGSTPGAGSSGTRATPRGGEQYAVPSPGMDNPI
jgi:14-3-3 protein